MTFILGALVTLAFLALLAFVALFTRDVRAEQRAPPSIPRRGVLSARCAVPT